MKLSVIKNGFFAVGKNELEQEVIDVGGGCPGLLPAPVASTSLLPTDWNGLGAPADGTIGIVEGGDDTAGIYVYQRNVNVPGASALLFDDWLPAWAAKRGVEYLVDTVVNSPLRISVRVGGDTVGALTAVARNFIAILTTGGSVVDVGSGATAAIRITGTPGGGPALSFLLWNNLDVTPGVVLFVVKVNKLPPVSSSVVSPNLAGMWEFQDGIRRIRVSHSFAGVPNEVRLAFTGINQYGSGVILPTAPFERLDFVHQIGLPYAPPPFQPSVRLTGNSFYQGLVPSTSDLAGNAPQHLNSSGQNFLIGCDDGGIDPFSSMDVQEFHALRVL